MARTTTHPRPVADTPNPLASGNEVNATAPRAAADGPQAQQPQQPGGGGAPGTGARPEPGRLARTVGEPEQKVDQPSDSGSRGRG
jgi:hypothetical protein